MDVALVRSAYSTNIREGRDCSCALFAADGDLIPLAEQIPVHLGSMQGLMAQIPDDQAAWRLEPGMQSLPTIRGRIRNSISTNKLMLYAELYSITDGTPTEPCYEP